MTYFLCPCWPQHLLPAEGQWLGTNQKEKTREDAASRVCDGFRLHLEPSFKPVPHLEDPTAQSLSDPTRLHPSQPHLEIWQGPRSPKARAPNFILELIF